jgi:hypothetical protein
MGRQPAARVTGFQRLARMISSLGPYQLLESCQENKSSEA